MIDYCAAFEREEKRQWYTLQHEKKILKVLWCVKLWLPGAEGGGGGMGKCLMVAEFWQERFQWLTVMAEYQGEIGKDNHWIGLNW